MKDVEYDQLKTKLAKSVSFMVYSITRIFGLKQ